MPALKTRLLAATIGALLVGLVAAPNAAKAADFSFTGTLATANDVLLFNFSVGTTSAVTLRSLGYAGGVNAAGVAIAPGGFDPILALFDSAGLLVDQNDDGGPPDVPPDPVTGAYFDTFLQALLAPGDYAVSVSVYPSFAVGPTLANGFTGGGNFTDVTGDARTQAWAFDILGVDSSSQPVPEPATLALFGLGLAGLAVARRRRQV